MRTTPPIYVVAVLAIATCYKAPRNTDVMERGETVVQVHGAGPFVPTYVN